MYPKHASVFLISPSDSLESVYQRCWFSFNRLLGMEKTVFFIFHKARESVLEYNYRDTYARALPSDDALNCVEETSLPFSLCVFRLRGRRAQSHTFLLGGSPLRTALARHGAWLSSPHADGEQGLGRVVLTFSWCKVLPSPLRRQKEKIAEAPLFFGSNRGNLVNIDFLFSETASSAQNFLPPEWKGGGGSLTSVFLSPLE